jgi:DNA replication protein DnaC
LDDIGAEVDEFKSGKATERLASLLEHRMHKYTLFTTNIDRKQWSIRWDKRVASRLHHKTLVVTLNGSDLRKTL